MGREAKEPIQDHSYLATGVSAQYAVHVYVVRLLSMCSRHSEHKIKPPLARAVSLGRGKEYTTKERRKHKTTSPSYSNDT